MPGAVRDQLNACATAAHPAYAWPTPIVVTAWACVRASTAADALVAALGRVRADLPAGALPWPAERAIVVGTRTAAYQETARFVREIESVGPMLVNPALFPLTVMNATAGIAAIKHQCEGPNVTLTDGVNSALDALVHGADLIAANRAAIAFVGGFETDVDWLIGNSTGAPSAIALIAALMTAERAAATGTRVCGRLVATAWGAFLSAEPVDVESVTIGAAAEAAVRAIGVTPQPMAAERITTGDAALPTLDRILTRLSTLSASVLVPLFAGPVDQMRGTALLVTGGVAA